MRKTLIVVCFLFMASTAGRAGGPPDQPPALRTDRWIELDLYWFDHEHIAQSVSQFLDRTYPLYKNATGWRGVIVNIGFLIDYITGFEGNLDEPVPLPEFHVKQWLGPQFQKLPYPLPMEDIKYPAWTYRDLKTLGEEFRRQAAERYGIKDFKFGSLLLGRHHDYNASGGGWRDAHPEIWDHRQDKTGVGPLNVTRNLHADHRTYPAFPTGIPEGTPFPHFFALQWGAVSRAVQFDALVLRDGMWGQVEYLKIGPFGDRASPDPQEMERWHRAIATLVRETKNANRHCLLLGFSNAVSAVSDWRIDGFDLERIAKEGYLDAWIDQSWGGAWNEYWNSHLIGYSFQLANILGHAAQLADTPTRHYVLVDTWDAYEPWDTLHTVPQKMRWEIWAYLHAAVKMPNGEKLPRGIYLSWANHGRELWSADDVKFIATNVDAATADALMTQETLGPTLVYNRRFVGWLQSTHPDWLIKEFFEDHAGMLMKWQVPILSITRPEWLPAVHSDLLVFQSPAQLEPKTAQEIRRREDAGEPLAFVGDPTWGIDPQLGEILRPPCKTLDQERSLQSADLESAIPGVTDDLAKSFYVWQGHYALAAEPRVKTVYATGACPDLVFEDSPKHHWLYWNPPFFSPKENANNGAETMSAVIADTEPYVLTARAFHKLLQETGRSPFDASELTTDPYEIHYWRRTDGKLVFLLGNLERDLPSDSALPKSLLLKIPGSMIGASGKEGWFRDVTGSGSVRTTQGPDGTWQVQLTVSAIGSGVWVFEE
jgi:hypothetical protein